jgi:hypothetical protein
MAFNLVFYSAELAKHREETYLLEIAFNWVFLYVLLCYYDLCILGPNDNALY